MKRYFAFLFLLFAFFIGGQVVEAEVFRKLTNVQGVAAPGANVDVPGVEYTWTGSDGEICRVLVQVETSTIVNFMLDNGATEIGLGLNSNAALQPGAAYVFDVPVQPGDIVTLQSETDTVWDKVTLGAVQ